MPKSLENQRGGATRYRTIRVGKGKNKKLLHIAIVRRTGPRGGHTVPAVPQPTKQDG